MTKHEIEELLGEVQLALQKGQFQKAETMTHLILDADHTILNDEEKTALLAEAHGQLSKGLCQMSRYDDAVYHFEKSLLFARRSKNSKLEGEALNTRGNVAMDQGDYRLALPFYLQALDIFISLNDKKFSASVMGNIGNVYSNVNDSLLAIKYLDKALHICDEIGYKVGVASHLGNLAIVYYQLSDYYKALDFFHQAVNT